jgi:hypothetical protein
MVRHQQASERANRRRVTEEENDRSVKGKAVGGATIQGRGAVKKRRCGAGFGAL